MAEVALNVEPNRGGVVEWTLKLDIGNDDGLAIEARKSYGDEGTHVNEGWCPATLGKLAIDLYRRLKERSEDGLGLPRAETRDWVERLQDAVRFAEAHVAS